MALDLSFKDLAEVAAGSGAVGRPLKLALDRIDEDPDQPRREFPDDELRNLAASIRIEGILQPIVVRPSHQDGRFVIVVGARRYRAAKLAGLAEVPAIVQEVGETNPYAQMIENIQRDDLKASEIARFITARLEAGEKQTEIARRLGKPRDWVSRFGAVPKMPPFLQEMLPTSSIRAVYELYQAWRQEPSQVERAVKKDITFTDAQAREFASTMRKAGSPCLTGLDTSQPTVPIAAVGSQHRAPQGINPPASPTQQARSSAVIRVRAGKRRGILLLYESANSGAGFARVAFDDGAIEDVTVHVLRIEAVTVG